VFLHAMSVQRSGVKGAPFHSGVPRQRARSVQYPQFSSPGSLSVERCSRTCGEPEGARGPWERELPRGDAQSRVLTLRKDSIVGGERAWVPHINSCFKSCFSAAASTTTAHLMVPHAKTQLSPTCLPETAPKIWVLRLRSLLERPST